MGPMVLGYMWRYCLYGMLLVQFYTYTEGFPKDRVGIKAVVWSMFVLETAFTILTTVAAWKMFGTGWGDTDTLLILDITWAPLPELNGILAGIAQSFYIWRIWRLTNKIWIPISIGCVMLVQVVAAFYFGIEIAMEGMIVEKLNGLSSEITLWLTGSAICDLLITISLVFMLSRRKTNSKFQRTSGLINKLIRFSVETGSVTSLGATIEVVLWLACRQWNFHFILFLSLGKLYSNMLMATLNCRAPVLQAGAATSGTMQHIPTSFWNDAVNVNTGRVAGLNLEARGVHISRTARVDNDGGPIIMTDFGSTSKTQHDSTGDKTYTGLEL
ncbi:hypothetical protein C8R43DRAFT_607308 [Mycena crocata]|nr:hypothetical protein C8R43DRAFT_607308 [Mycena crocata]